MATSSKYDAKATAAGAVEGPRALRGGAFDVIRRQVIGTIEPGNGSHTATEAAFLLIGKNPEEGTYEFPTYDGVCIIEVSYRAEPDRIDAA